MKLILIQQISIKETETTLEKVNKWNFSFCPILNIFEEEVQEDPIHLKMTLKLNIHLVLEGIEVRGEKYYR